MKLYTVLLIVMAAFTSCSYEGSVSVHWNPLSGELLVNNHSVESDPYHLNTREGSTVTVEFIPNRAKGWIFSHWLFEHPFLAIADSFHGNPLEFIAGYDRSNLEAIVEQYNIEDYTPDGTENSIFMNISPPTNRYYHYHISNDSFTPISGRCQLINRSLRIEEYASGVLSYFLYREESNSQELIVTVQDDFLTDCNDYEMSPDNSRIAFNENWGGAGSSIHLLSIADSAVASLNPGENLACKSFIWSPSGSRLYARITNTQTNQTAIYEIGWTPQLSLRYNAEIPYSLFPGDSILTDESGYGYGVYGARLDYQTFNWSNSSLYMVNLNTGTTETQALSERIPMENFFRHDGRVYINTETDLILLSGFQQESIFTYTDEDFLEGDLAKPLSTPGEFLVRSRINETNDLYLYDQNTGIRTRITTPERILPLLETAE